MSQVTPDAPPRVGEADGVTPSEPALIPTPPRTFVTPDVFDATRAPQYASGDVYRPGNADVFAPPAEYVRGSGEPGWTHWNPSDQGWVDYQLQIAGVTRTLDGAVPEWVELSPDGTPVKFDGHTFRGDPPLEVFLDAKDWSRGIAFGDPTNPYWAGRRQISTAVRQLDALPDGALLECTSPTPLLRPGFGRSWATPVRRR